MVCKSKEGDGIALTCFITNLNLAFELGVNRPLKGRRFQRMETLLRPENVTDVDENMRRRLGAKWRGSLRIEEIIASTSSCGFKGKAKSPIRALKEDRHLQFRLFDVVCSIGDGMRSPQRLGHHSSFSHNLTVKQPVRLVGKVR